MPDLDAFQLTAFAACGIFLVPHGGNITLGPAVVRGTIATVELSATEPTP